MNTMIKVLCPQNGNSPTFANSTKDRDYRCTKCGVKGHQKAGR